MVPMYVTDRACEPAGAFRRPSRRIDAAHIGGARGRSQRHHREISRITRGAGPRWGSAALGIEDLSVPDYGDAVEIRPNEVPVFWGVRVTPQAVAERARPELMVSHAPGHMFLTDLPAETGQRSEEAGRAGS